MYTHITRDDRVIISNSLRMGESYAKIGVRISKNKGAICREVDRNKDPYGRYRVWSADKIAQNRRKNSKYHTRKIENDNKLARTIEEKLHPLVSPEVIAHEVGITHETIYAWISRSRPDLKVQLPQRNRKRRRYGSKRSKKQGWTKDVRSIDERLLIDENWEGDTIKGSTRSRVLTHVEYDSLFTVADLMSDGTADSVHAKTKQRQFAGTITYDRGSEFALWRMIEKDTPATVYFAHAHHPWERGKNENTNGRLRRVFPKKFDFATIKQRDLDLVVWKMNHTKRKTLNWRTPCSVYGKCCTSG
ncbi:MAG TPA: IS30 family transposase [Candidatus Yonathbacteria bacterium]|nr:IS30 family transposase [Candidatus Yonathbacteria bacterium]